jgi:hypothetical protein
MPNITQARDDILTRFRTEWLADGISAPVKLVFDDFEDDLPSSTSPWTRITVRHATGGQISLSNEAGKRRYDRKGTVFVQIFTPFGDGLTLSDSLAIIAARAFEGKETPLHVWFRDVRFVEVGRDGHWYNVNVLAAFEYDEVK